MLAVGTVPPGPEDLPDAQQLKPGAIPTCLGRIGADP